MIIFLLPIKSLYLPSTILYLPIILFVESVDRLVVVSAIDNVGVERVFAAKGESTYPNVLMGGTYAGGGIIEVVVTVAVVGAAVVVVDVGLVVRFDVVVACAAELTLVVALTLALGLALVVLAVVLGAEDTVGLVIELTVELIEGGELG